MHHSSEKLEQIRGLMEQRNVDAYLIPDTDPHIGEYKPEHWEIIKWVTGFTGSSATVVITVDSAMLWTDSRYFIQAARQLAGSGIDLVKPDAEGKNDLTNWLVENLETGSTIGFDGRLISIARFRHFRNSLKEKKITFDTDCDIINQLWLDRPPLPSGHAFSHELTFAGKERHQKLSEVRSEMKKRKAGFMLVTSPDEIMWLMNIRGRDIEFSPLLLSFAIISMEQVLLFTFEEKIPYRLARELDEERIIILPYEETAGILSTLRSSGGIIISPESTSVSLFSAIPGRLKIREEISILAMMKAVKNKTELANIEKTMVRDGVALTRFFYSIFHNRKDEMTELSLTQHIDRIRSGMENNIGVSFPTIVAYNEHAALPHYRADENSNSVIGSDGILLVDSGGQYLDGTTDITRTVCLGEPTENQKRDFTLVLKGMISLATASFPEGTHGYQLDTLARRFLWQHGFNYGHGTGHGVGYCLNVHEGPFRISPKASNNYGNIILPGIIVSDEPAIYREGEYGIRTENILLCYEDEETEFGRFNTFCTLSLCYIDQRMIDISLLDQDEINWLNKYHEEVFEKIAPSLTKKEKGWLRMMTAPLSKVPE